MPERSAQHNGKDEIRLEVTPNVNSILSMEAIETHIVGHENQHQEERQENYNSVQARPEHAIDRRNFRPVDGHTYVLTLVT